MSIKKKIIYSIILFIIIPMLLMPAIIFYQSKTVIEEKINSLTEQQLENISNNIETIIDDIISSSNILTLDSGLINLLKKEQNNFSDWNEIDKKITNKIGNAESAVLYPYNIEVSIIDFKGNAYYIEKGNTPITIDYREFLKKPHIKKVINGNGKILWFAPRNKYFHSNLNNKYDLVMLRLIKGDKYVGGYGILMISINPGHKVSEILNIGGDDFSELYLVNKSGHIILKKSSSVLNIGENIENLGINLDNLNFPSNSFSKIINGNKANISYNTISKTDWKLVQITPYNYMTQEINRMKNITLLINIIFIVVIIMILILVSAKISKPIMDLTGLMSHVQKGDFTVRANLSNNSNIEEINKLSINFNTMIDKIDDLIKQKRTEYEIRQKYRLEALQSQINPHFLLNTLDGIKWMCTMSGAENSSKMVSDLGYLLETTIGKNEEMITLSEEIKCIESYVSIQQMRYSDSFSVNYDIPDSLLNYKVPALLLQPVVENSIIHGFSNLQEEGIIQIKVHEREDDLIITVKDNGRGMSQIKLSSLSASIKTQEAKFSKIGLKNVNERIKLIYGQKYGLEIISNKEKGTTVRIYLPKFNDIEEDIK